METQTGKKQNRIPLENRISLNPQTTWFTIVTPNPLNLSFSLSLSLSIYHVLVFQFLLVPFHPSTSHLIRSQLHSVTRHNIADMQERSRHAHVKVGNSRDLRYSIDICIQYIYTYGGVEGRTGV